MGAQTDAARAEVLRRRGELLEEVDRLESAGRAAVDIPAKVRKAPAKTAGIAAGAVFLLAGGPKRLIRRARRVVQGPEADMPKGLTPKEVDRVLSHLGTDGEKVRRVLDREFADYLEEHSQERRKRDLSATASMLAGSVLGPVTQRVGKQLAKQLFSPESSTFADTLAGLRERRTGGPTTETTAVPKGTSGPTTTRPGG